MSDKEVLNTMQDGLNEAGVFALKDLKAVTIAGTIPTTISDSGASTTCAQPAGEQIQASECGLCTWYDPLIKTNKWLTPLCK